MESIKKILRQFEFTLQEAINNFLRSGWMSWIVITTMVACLSLFGGFLLLMKDFSFIADSIGSKLQIVVFLKKDASIDKAYEQISKIDGVSKLEAIPKEKGWDELKNDLQNNLELENIGSQNPLPDSLQITVNIPRNVELVAAKVKEMPEIEEIKYSKELANYIEQLSHLIRLIGIAITAILGSATLAIIVNTIRLAVNSRKTEIEIMRLVGATDWFIRMPFLLEGVFFGFFSAVFTSIILIVWRSFSISQVKKLFPFIPISEDPTVIWNVIIFTLLASIIIGFLGSILSIHRYLSFEKPNPEG